MSVTLEGSSYGLQKKHRCGSLSWKRHWFFLKIALWTFYTRMCGATDLLCSYFAISSSHRQNPEFFCPMGHGKTQNEPPCHFHTCHNGGWIWCLISSSRWWTAPTVTVHTIKINQCDEGRKAFESQSLQTHVYKVTHTNSWHWWNPSLPWGGPQFLCPSLFLQSPLNLITSILIQNHCPGS